ncbi:MAG TPA: methyltransferase domain-containing protein [Methylomirabilota bacterium]|nr:methyltransferase domain-containing protein [Methylomirabilota bacterium]
MKALFDLTPWGLKRRLDSVAAHMGRADARFDGVERRLDAAEEALRALQNELAELRDRRLAAAEARLDAEGRALASVSDEAVRLRDRVVPAVVDRADALLERLAAELEELGSIVERMLRDEPLPVPVAGAAAEDRLASALAKVQPALLEAFRGAESEIRHRLERYLEPLEGSAPVLDLGCGRGELLLLLREAGVAASGVEGDPAVAQAARRRGLEVVEGDVLEVLRGLPDASRGAVTAIHLLEHLDAATLLAVLAEVRRVLRPGGLVIAECPNPHSLRVGAGLYWVDPTHRRPLPPETLELYLKTSGFEVDGRELLHPFPAEQRFADGGEREPAADPRLAALEARLDRFAARLDELVNGPRDFVIFAHRGDDPTA